MKKSIACILLTLVICCALLPLTAFASGDVPQAVLDLRQSVVRIICQSSDNTSTGSGFAIGTDEPVKYIVTSLHVVEPNPNGVTVLRENNREIPAKIYLQVDDADLCVLLLDEELYGVPPLKLQDGKDASVGQAVYALGFPGAADELVGSFAADPDDITITDGIVSAVKPFTEPNSSTQINLLQINAAINHGNSGGPLVDEKGVVVGVNALGMDNAQSINGAISILELIKALKERGVPYLSSETKSSGFPLMTVVIIAGSIVLAALIALFIMLMIRRARKSKGKPTTAPVEKEIPLAEYLKPWGGHLPYDMAARLLTPSLQQMSAMHQAGRVHGHICPENITVNANSVQATLHIPQQTSQAGALMLHTGFSAPEQYRADGRIGPWSDVYSICAVFYFVITGKAPLGVMERMALGGIGAVGFGEAAIDQTHGSALLSGLALDAAARPQNAVELANVMGIAPAPSLPEPAFATPVIATAAPLAAVTKPPKKRMKTGKKLLIAGLATLFVLFAGAGGFYLYTDGEYNKAVECIRKQDYKAGVNGLSHVLGFFKDTGKWMNFACAGDALQQDNFDSARKGFSGLSNFNEADKMLKEVDYRQSFYLLTKGDFEKARSMFKALGAYKDSEQMIHEADYQKAKYLCSTGNFSDALEMLNELTKLKYKDSESTTKDVIYFWSVSLFQAKDYTNALKKMESIIPYKDSKECIAEMYKSIYNEGIKLYRNHDYTSASKLFVITKGYEKSNSYSDLILIHNIISSQSVNLAQRYYSQLVSFGSFEDAPLLRENSVFFLNKIAGDWRQKGTNYYLSVDYSWQTGWMILISTSSKNSDSVWGTYDNITIKGESIYVNGKLLIEIYNFTSNTIDFVYKGEYYYLTRIK